MRSLSHFANTVSPIILGELWRDCTQHFHDVFCYDRIWCLKPMPKSSATYAIVALFTTLFFKSLAVSLHHVTHLAHFLPTNPDHFSTHLHHHTGQFGVISQQP